MSDKKGVNVSERRCSDASSVSTRSGISQTSHKSKRAEDSSSRRSSISTAVSTSSGYALSHTLSSSSQFVDPLKRIPSTPTIPRADNLKIRLLTTAEMGMAERFFDKETRISSYGNSDEYPLPAISGALVLQFDSKPQIPMTSGRSWIHLSSCRAHQNPRVNKFIKDCYIRLREMKDEEAFLELPPCFYLSKLEFKLGSSDGCATSAWLAFDASYVRRTINSAKVTSINGDLARWRGLGSCTDDCYRDGCWCVEACINIIYGKVVNGKKGYMQHEVPQERIDSNAAFPKWLSAWGTQGFSDWCGTPEATEGGRPYLKNFKAINIRLNYFGEVVKLDLVRSPEAPKGMPQPLKPASASVTKKGFIRKHLSSKERREKYA